MLRFNFFVFFLMALIVASNSVIADHQNGNGWRQSNWDVQHVILFRDCGYGGPSKEIPIGDYARLREIGIGQKAISSVIIPEGLALEIFQGVQFGGHWYRLNQNQVCLKGNWNDSIGSIRVVKDKLQNSFGFSQNYGGGHGGKVKRCYPFVVRSFEGAGGIRFIGEEDRLTPVRPGREVQGELCRNGNARVELAKKERGAGVVLQIANREYRFQPWAEYDDFRGNWYRRYINIELPGKNRSGIKYGSNGWGDTAGFGKRYSSGVRNGANWGNNYKGEWYRNTKVNEPSYTSSQPSSGNNSRKDCITYSVTGNHKDIGIRFLAGSQEFHLTGHGTKKRQLCHKGKIKFELSKKKVPGEVIVRIAGKVFVFGQGDRGDRLANNWYRKYFEVNVR